MEPIKQIRSVADSYKQMVEAREQRPEKPKPPLHDDPHFAAIIKHNANMSGFVGGGGKPTEEHFKAAEAIIRAAKTHTGLGIDKNGIIGARHREIDDVPGRPLPDLITDIPITPLSRNSGWKGTFNWGGTSYRLGSHIHEQTEYIEMLENTIQKIAQELEIEPEELIESVTLGRLNLSTLGASIKSLMGGRKKESTIGTKPMPGTISRSPYDPYVGEKETPRGDVPQGAIPKGLFTQPSGYSEVRRMTGDETQSNIAKRTRNP